MKFLKTRDAVIIMVVAFLLPNIFAHVWWLRLLSTSVVCLVLTYEIIRQVIHSGLIFRDASLWNPKAKKIFIWFARILLVAILPLSIFGVIAPLKDLAVAVTSGGPIVNTVQITTHDTGFTWLALRKLEISGESKGLPLYLLPLKTGENYQITYLPGSYFVYDAVSVE